MTVKQFKSSAPETATSKFRLVSNENVTKIDADETLKDASRPCANLIINIFFNEKESFCFL